MKLLFDENLSDKIVGSLVDLYPHSSHVKSFGLIRTADSIIWSFAAQRGFAIVSKDSDFRQRALVRGAPPKLIFLRVGNCPTERLIALLRIEFPMIGSFLRDPAASILVLA